MNTRPAAHAQPETAEIPETPDSAGVDSGLLRPGYRLQDSLWADAGAVFLTGTQALVRLMLMQKARDAAQGLDTRGFVSGYRGSPLGMVDQAIWKAGIKLEPHGIDFVPGINEELAATQVLGTQRVESDPERTVQGVFGLWYGKGPGVDRAGDAIKHGNAFGASPHGGVLVVAGDDHGCVSSSMPHQSDQVFQAWHMPIVSPSCVAEYLEYGLYGWQLSRFSGNWVAMTALSEVVESGATVDLDALQARVAAWQDNDAVQSVDFNGDRRSLLRRIRRHFSGQFLQIMLSPKKNWMWYLCTEHENKYTNISYSSRT